VADTGTPELSNHEFSIAYDGTALVTTGDHSIDVQTLAPALLAIGKLIREANTEFNGKKSTAKVLVVSDFEHKCFNINFEVIVSWYTQLQTILGAEPVKTAKDVLEWLGLLGATKEGGLLSYLDFLKRKNGRAATVTKTISDVSGTGVIEVQIHGDGAAVQIRNHVYELSKNPQALRATRDAFLPLGQDGFDSVKITEGSRVVEEISADQVEAIVKSCTAGIEESKLPPEPEVEITPASFGANVEISLGKRSNIRGYFTNQYCARSDSARRRRSRGRLSSAIGCHYGI
jgi:hypothetical protein